MQIGAFIFLFMYASSLDLREDVRSRELLSAINDIKVENRAGLDEVARELAEQKSDTSEAFASQEESFRQQINFIKSSQSDFSGIVEEAVKSVVTIATDRSAATGFVIDGMIVTNNHAIAGSRDIRVQTYRGEVYPASIVGVNENLDIAILNVSEVLPTLELEDSDSINVGEKVIAIGNPLGLSFSVTQGIISAKNRLGPNGLPIYLQTDVTLNPGNSGGPLINSQGKVVGINNFKIGEAEGLGFALESNYLAEAVRGITGNA